MSKLTPYDTGERLEPKLWAPASSSPSIVPSTAKGDFGKVDFDNEENATIATLWIERKEDGSYVLKGYTNEPLEVEINGQS